MSGQTKTILDVALGLSEDDRALIAARLLDTLPIDAPIIDDDEWEAELDRRFAETLTDPDASIPWSSLRDER